MFLQRVVGGNYQNQPTGKDWLLVANVVSITVGGLGGSCRYCKKNVEIQLIYVGNKGFASR